MIVYGLKTKQFPERFFEDVKEGDEVTPYALTPYNLGKMTMWAAVHADFCAGHYDYKCAKERFQQDAPFAYGMQIATYQSQMITDWMGPWGMLKKFRSTTVHPTLDKDQVTCYGKVIKTYPKDEKEGYVECETRAQIQDGTIVGKGTATVILRRKKDLELQVM